MLMESEERESQPEPARLGRATLQMFNVYIYNPQKYESKLMKKATHGKVLSANHNFKELRNSNRNE